MTAKTINRPDFPDTSDLDSEQAIEELRSTLSEWVVDNAGELEPEDVIGAATEEIFVPFRLTYPDILRTWLEIHAEIQGTTDEAQILIEKIIEITILDESESGDLIKDTL